MEQSQTEISLYRIYYIVMACLFVAIEYAQIALPVRVAALLKTIPAVLTAFLGLRFLVKHGCPNGRNRYLAGAVLAVGVADILLCFLTTVVPVMSSVPGVMAFCVMELLLMLWLGADGGSILLHGITVGLLLAFGIAAHRTDLYSVTAEVNLGLLMGNLIQGAVICHRLRTRTARIYLIAAIGIAVCDYGILLRTVITSELLKNLASEVAWLGYVPFLVLLLLTLRSAEGEDITERRIRPFDSGKEVRYFK